jgi:hypothetical protein
MVTAQFRYLRAACALNGLILPADPRDRRDPSRTPPSVGPVVHLLYSRALQPKQFYANESPQAMPDWVGLDPKSLP